MGQVQRIEKNAFDDERRGVERRYRSLPTSRNDCEWFETMAADLTSCQWKLDTRPQLVAIGSADLVLGCLPIGANT